MEIGTIPPGRAPERIVEGLLVSGPQIVKTVRERAEAKLSPYEARIWKKIL